MENALQSRNSKGTLSVVPTPIGNLGDITVRAIERLRAVDIVVCEDTRISKRLFAAHDIEPRQLISMSARTEKRRVDQIIAMLNDARDVGLISDAGMPTVSDPGSQLVDAAISNGIPVDVLPGPSAHVAALVGSGLTAVPYMFEGFLPHKKGRKTRLEVLSGRSETTVLYESPHRLVRLLAEVRDHCGPDRQVCVARELTKVFQEFRRGSVDEVHADFDSRSSVKGECVVIIEGTEALKRRGKAGAS
jgi:16S rRNA (cytidine1402-2'-O)-methyltransferase